MKILSVVGLTSCQDNDCGDQSERVGSGKAQVWTTALKERSCCLNLHLSRLASAVEESPSLGEGVLKETRQSHKW